MSIHQNRKIKVSVPGRICLFGDKIDLLSKPVIGATINSLMRLEISKSDGNLIEFHSKDMNFSKRFNINDKPDFDHPLKYWSAIVERLKDKISGFKAEIKSEIPIGSGLSSSAALSISLIKGLNLLFDLKMETKDIAELAYLCEHNDLGIMCGRLDQYTIAYGGIVFIETGEIPIIEKISLKSLPVIVGDSQEERLAKSVLNRIKAQIKDENPTILDAFKEIEKIVTEGKKALINRDFKKVGSLMTLQHEQEKILGASTDKLNLLCEKSIESGAFGAKLMGAGGGGCMVAICPENNKKVEKKIVNAIIEAGGKPHIFNIYNY